MYPAPYLREAATTRQPDGPISLKTANKKPLHAVAIVMSPQHIKFRAAIAAVYKIYICIYIHTTVLYIYIYIFIYTYSLLASSSLGGSSSGDSCILFVKLLFILEPDFDPRVVHNLFTLIHVSGDLCDCEKTLVCAPWLYLHTYIYICMYTYIYVYH